MNWRTLLYCAFDNGLGREPVRSLVELEDLHEYAVFLRTRLALLGSPEDQVRHLPFVLENLIDTYAWDPRGACEFLEWLNPFNDYRGSTYDILEKAEELAEKQLEGKAIRKKEVLQLINQLQSLPHFKEGRLACFSSLSHLQQYAVFCSLQHFEARYREYLSWLERLELSMALFYWQQASMGWSLDEVEKLCAEHLIALSTVPDSPWKALQPWLEHRQTDSWASFFAWKCPPDADYVSEFAPTPTSPIEQRKEFTQWLSKALPEQIAAFPQLYAWIYRGSAGVDCFWTAWGMNLVSPKVQNIFEQMQLSETVRCVPVDLMDKDSNNKLGNYYLAIYLVRLSCLSRERTIGIWNRDYKKVLDLHHPVLIQDRIGRHELFVVAEYPQLIVVSKRLKEALEQAGVSGCRFEGITVVESCE